jgi:hypothetical protein
MSSLSPNGCLQQIAAKGVSNMTDDIRDSAARLCSRFGCWLTTTVVKKDGEADLERYVELPFAPTPGMKLNFDERRHPSFFVDDVEYVVEDGVFFLTERDEPDLTDCGCEPGDGCCTLDFSLKWYTESGWTISAIRRGYDRCDNTLGMFEPEKWIGTRSSL